MNTEKNQYHNISATKYAILHASSLCKTLCKTWKAMSCPLYLALALPPPPSHIFFFFCFLKNLLRLKINILSSIYPVINFPAEPVMKINNLSRPKVPAPPPPSESNGRPLSPHQHLSPTPSAPSPFRCETFLTFN